MKALETGSVLGTVFAVASFFFVLAVLTVGGLVAGVAGYSCW